MILELLAEERRPHFIRYGLKAASTSLYPSEAIDQRIVDLLSNKDEQLREFAISVAGLRKQRSAVPQLIAALGDKNENVSRASVVSLGQIGDPSAIPAIVRLYDREFATVVIYSIRRIQDEALRSLTGTKDSRAAAGWKEFVNAQ
jgi:HEAT repeat protein